MQGRAVENLGLRLFLIPPPHSLELLKQINCVSLSSSHSPLMGMGDLDKLVHSLKGVEVAPV